MGVSCILMWEPPEGLSIGQALESFLQKRLEILGILGQKTAFMMHSSEYPRTTFLVLESLLCLVAENSLDTIFAHLKQFYPPRKQAKIEVKGKMFLVKQQYLVKFGAISIGSVNRGIVVEVEDQEHNRVSQSWNELTAFTKGLLDSSVSMDVPLFARQSDRPYLPSDSMIHYAFIFDQLRKSPVAAGAIR